MSDLLLRGRVLSFDRMPIGAGDERSFTYVEDGCIRISDGHVSAVGEWRTVGAQATGAIVIDHRPHLITPGFVDPHVHFPQTQVIASWGAKLLDWLENYTFPEEARYDDPDLSRRMAKRFCDLLVSHGTTTTAAFCSVHATSADALFAEAVQRDMRIIAGKVMMDRNAPANLLDTAQSGYDDSRALIEKWHGHGRVGYAITPRFAITSSSAQLEAAGALAAEHLECHVQTHLSENTHEIAYTAELYPDARDYLDVYEAHGLLGPRTLLGHCIHLEPREIDSITETGAHPVFCPTSNLFLGSGLFDADGLAARGIVGGVASDTGGGTSYSMLTTLAEGYKVLHLRHQNLHPYQAFHWMTAGNAGILDLDHRIGRIAPGYEADLVVLDARATPVMANRMERAETLAEELFVLQMLGDDRTIAETYIAGQPAKSTIQWADL